jgi:predicted DNA-binding transcriptional regulator YafY
VTPLARKLRRVLFLVPYVAKHPDGVSLVELSGLLEVPPRVLEREIAGLLTVGVPQGDPGDFLDLCVEGRGTSARVYATHRLLRRPPRLTTAEAFALLLGASALRRTGIVSFDEALARAEQKIRALMGKAEDGNATPPSVTVDAKRKHAGTLDELSRANRDRRAVELDYASVAGQRRKKIVVEPYGLLNHSGGWYVLGKSLTHAEDRIFVFKVERILGVTRLERSFTVPPTFDLRKYAGDRLFIGGLAKVEIKLRLRGAAVKRLGSAFKNGRLERGGTMLVRFRDVPTGSLAAWVLRQGAEVEVLGPSDLAHWVQVLAARVEDAHGKQAATGTLGLAASSAKT